MAKPAISFGAPELLNEAHDLSVFISGEDELDSWLRERALHNLRNAASRTYVICREDSRQVVGYYSVNMAQILNQEVVGSMRRNMPAQIPAVLLGRLAIDRGCQGKGLGTQLLRHAVDRAVAAAAEVSARLLMVHALSDAAEAFYTHYGFTRLPVEQRMLALDLVKLAKLQS